MDAEPYPFHWPHPIPDFDPDADPDIDADYYADTCAAYPDPDDGTVTLLDASPIDVFAAAWHTAPDSATYVRS